MFAEKLKHQNSFLRLSCPDYKSNLITNGMNEIFFRHLPPTVVMQQRLVIKECLDFKQKYSRGYGRNGFINLLNNLSITDNLDLIANSLEQLNNELKNSSIVPLAIRHGVIERIYVILTQITSFTNPIIMPCALKMLNSIAMDFRGANTIANDDKIMKLVFELMRSQKDLREFCNEILFTMSLDVVVADALLKRPKFVKNLKFQLNFLNDQKFIEALANLISRQPKLFTSPEIVKCILEDHNTLHSEAFKCLSFILNTDESDELIQKFDVARTLSSILFKCTREEIKTNVVMALRSCVINKKPFCHSGFPWRLILKLLIDAAYTKANIFLQLTSIQTLRIMSDVSMVKNELGKVYKLKLKGIKCLSSEIEDLKHDLLQWLDYKSFKMNNGNKYEKMFI